MVRKMEHIFFQATKKPAKKQAFASCMVDIGRFELPTPTL